MGRFAKTSAGRGKGDMGGKRITRREQNATATDKKLRNLIERLLQVEVLVIENEQEVFTAMVALKQEHESFADALMAELGAGGVYSHSDIRPKGDPPSWLRTYLIDPRSQKAPPQYSIASRYTAPLCTTAKPRAAGSRENDCRPIIRCIAIQKCKMGRNQQLALTKPARKHLPAQQKAGYFAFKHSSRAAQFGHTVAINYEKMVFSGASCTRRS
jgi:hypothetical protein